MSIEMTLRLVLIGIIGFILVISFALGENSYGPRRRREAEEQDSTV